MTAKQQHALKLRWKALGRVRCDICKGAGAWRPGGKHKRVCGTCLGKGYIEKPPGRKGSGWKVPQKGLTREQKKTIERM